MMDCYVKLLGYSGELKNVKSCPRSLQLQKLKKYLGGTSILIPILSINKSYDYADLSDLKVKELKNDGGNSTGATTHHPFVTPL